MERHYFWQFGNARRLPLQDKGKLVTVSVAKALPNCQGGVMASKSFQQKLGLSFDKSAQKMPLLPPDPPTSPAATTPTETTPKPTTGPSPSSSRDVAITAPADLFPVLPVDPRPDIVQDSRQW